MGDNGRAIGRRTFLKRTGAAGTALAAGLVSPRAPGEEPLSKPNVLFIFADQQRASALGCYPADEDIYTPHFDAFAKRGMRVETAISNTPVCCPFRASLMTGKYGHHNGVVTNRLFPEPGKHPFLAETFRKAGYTCGYIGKWHLGEVNTDPGDPRRLGFHDYWCTNYSDSRHRHYAFYIAKDKQIKGECFYRPQFETDRAIEFIRNQPRTKPWCLFMSWFPPHMPFNSPEQYLARYQDKALRLHPNVPEGEASRFANRFLPHYYGLIEGLDVEFGRLMDELASLGLSENTIVIYTSDHGEMMGGHGLAGKRWPHRDSTDIPFLIRWPKHIQAGSTLSMPFGTPDMFPTLAGLAGIEVPAGLDGTDFSPLLIGRPGAKEQEWVYMAMHHTYVPWPGWRGVRSNRYMYARIESEPWLLFDLKNDPFEQHNLLKDKPALVKELDALLRDRMEEVGDTWRDAQRPGGDWEKWLPGAEKQLHQVCDGNYPGKQIPEVANWRQMVYRRLSTRS